MKVSFIIPVYNCGQYLDKFVREIEDIELQDYEIILVDDGSTDDSGRICDRLAETSAKIFCIHQENKGVSSARNNGLHVAVGEYICFFDADDDIESEKLREIFEEIRKQKKVIDIVFFGMSFDYYYKGKMYRREEMKPPLQGSYGSGVWLNKLNELFYANSLSSICNKVFRREFLIKYELLFSEDMFLYEDLEYMFRCMEYGENSFFEPEAIYHYRQQEGEENVGRRLMRIDHISNLIIRIEKAANGVKIRTSWDKINNILISLYLILARGKINISNPMQIKQICDDFACWYQSKAIDIPLENQKFADMLLRKDVKQLILKREYIKIRHKIAIAVKNTRIYQKLKG